MNSAVKHIIESKSYIIQRSLKQSFAKHSLKFRLKVFTKRLILNQRQKRKKRRVRAMTSLITSINQLSFSFQQESASNLLFVECEFGHLCAFAHSEEELGIDLLHKMQQDSDFYIFHFKTVWCPFNDDSKNHHRERCEYAHNWQDFRRKPDIFDYTDNFCSRWSKNKEIKVYSDGCELEYGCKHAHGWKEVFYHHKNYKTSRCDSGQKCSRVHCPNYHNESERRRPSLDAILLPKIRLAS